MFNDGKKKNKIDVDDGINVDDIVVDVDVRERPKNRKQIRLEKKEAKKKAVLSMSSSSSPESLTLASKNHKHNNDEMIEKSEYRRLKKIQQKEFRKGQEKMMRNEIREEKKIRKRKKLHREMNAKGGAAAAAAAATKKRKKATRNSDNSVNEERDVSINVFQSVFHGNNNNVNGSAAGSSGGITTTRLGVQYEDVVIGKGKVVSEGVPVTVKYELTGGQFGVVIDSSKSFQFRLGMGEVIQGWDIGLEGIKVGGRRKLRVPPKAGYFGKDIGAGPGAMLNFDISVIACGNL